MDAIWDSRLDTGLYLFFLAINLYHLCRCVCAVMGGLQQRQQHQHPATWPTAAVAAAAAVLVV